MNEAAGGAHVEPQRRLGAGPLPAGPQTNCQDMAPKELRSSAGTIAIGSIAAAARVLVKILPPLLRLARTRSGARRASPVTSMRQVKLLLAGVLTEHWPTRRLPR